MPKLTDCPPVQFYTTKEVAKLQLAVTRIVQGLDPSSALKAMKDAVVSDFTENAAKFAKAAAEGIGSEFTQNLIKGIFDQVLDEVISALPPGEARTIAQKVQSLADINFSMIQLALQLADTSPLVMASKAKKAFIQIVEERDAEIQKAITLCKELRQICTRAEQLNAASSDSAKTTIAKEIEKSYGEVKTKLQSADEALLKVQAGIIKKVIDSANLDSAKNLINEAIRILSPLDNELDATAITTNEELIGLLRANFSDADIVTKLYKASGVNSFTYDSESIQTLRDEGMSNYVERIFISLQSVPKKEDPLAILWKQINDKTTEINKQAQILEEYENKVSNILKNYLTIKDALEAPKAQDIHAGPMYDRVIVKCRSMISKIILKIDRSTVFLQAGARPGTNEYTTRSVGSWIAELAVVLSLLDVVQQGMYEEKKLNANPLNSQYYKAYENSFDSFKNSPRGWLTDTTRASNLSFQSGVNSMRMVAGGAHSAIFSSDLADIKRILARMDTDIKNIENLKTLLNAAETDARTHLDKYSPEPEIPDLFDKLFDMVKKLGFDRVYDQLVEGGLVNVLNMPPELATYVGAAAACLREKAQQASNEFERRKFEKASLKLSKKNRSRHLGKVNMSMRSVQAVKNLKARMEEIFAMVKSLFEQDIRTVDRTLTDGTFTTLPNL